MKATLRLLAFFLASSLSTSSWAGAIFALTGSNAVTTPNQLMVVNSDVPQEILSILPITGLNPNETVLGIDVRPATGELYALSDGPRILKIDPNTAAVTFAATLTSGTSTAALSGSNFSIDFDPVGDRLRVVSDARQNLRVNPSTGQVTVDPNLFYAPGDPNVSGTANVSTIAYSPAVSGSTTLFGIDDAPNFRIVSLANASNGMLVSGSSFGQTGATHLGFDIAPDGKAFVLARHDVPGFPVEYNLSTIDPVTGVSVSRGPIGDGTIAVRDIAVAPTISFSAPHYAVNESGNTTATITVVRENFVNVSTPVTVNYTTFNDTASAGSDYTTSAGRLVFNPVAPGTNIATQTFEVPIRDDAAPEDDELVDLFLSDIVGPAVLGPPSVATLRINKNDRVDKVGPQVRFIGFTGPSRGIDGAVVHFNEDMDPTTVQNVANYKLFVFPKTGGYQVKSFTSATYDPVERRVTLTLPPFAQSQFVRTAVRINGRHAVGPFGTEGVKDVAGNLLDGDRNRVPGGDAVQVFRVFSATKLTYLDRDGDQVTLQLTDLGPTTRLDGVIPVGGPVTQLTQFWILDPLPLKTALSGTVRPKGDGIVVIAEIIGLDKMEFTPLLNNTSFRVNTLTFSSNARGIK